MGEPDPATPSPAHPPTQLFTHPGATVVSVRVSEPARTRAARALGLDALPSHNRTAATPLGTCLWVRPDGWLVTGTDASRGPIIATLAAGIGEHEGAVVDISSARVLLELAGHTSRDVLASCCPLDLHPRVFQTGQCALSLVARAPVLLHLVDETPRWHLYVRPSLTAYIVGWLMDAVSDARAT